MAQGGISDTNTGAQEKSGEPRDSDLLKSSLTRIYEERGIARHKSPGSKLCTRCLKVMAQFRKFQRSSGLSSSGLVRHYKAYSTVQRAAEGGCILCAAFVQSPIKTDRLSYTEAAVAMQLYSMRRDTCSLRLKHQALEGGVTEEVTYVDSIDTELKEPIEAGPESVWASCSTRFVQLIPAAIPELDYSRHYSTQDSLSFCKTWLNHCVTHHKEQCQGGRLGVLPTRLIAVSGTTARLCLGGELQYHNTRYATLSHCWGRQPFLTLTEKNLDEFYQQIPVHDLTKTFQDAILTTRYLGLEYLWVDALCITQDSDQDWKHEAARMADVYSNGCVNIAATSAVDGRDGLFFPRPANWRYQVRLRNESGSGIEAFDCAFDDWDVTTAHALTRRAWVVQERCLSQRTLHFTNRQVFWECNCGHYCESGPHGYVRPDPVRNRSQHVLETFQMQRRCPTMRTWCNIVQAYTECALTRRSDKLAAIAGFARAVQPSLKGPKRYIAGMWELDLYRQLTWRTKEPGTRESSIKSPSWAWSSVEAVIECYFHGDHEFIHVDQPIRGRPEQPVRVESINIQYLPPGDEFGSVASAILRMRCQYLYNGTVHPFKTENIGDILYNFKCASDTETVMRTLDIQWDLESFPLENTAAGVPVHLFPLRTLETRGRKDSSAQGLILISHI